MSPLTRRQALALGTGTVATSVVGCLGTIQGDNDSSEDIDGTGELGDPADSVEVRVTSSPYPQFMPRIVHITVGGTVTWYNEDGRHDVTAYHPDTHGPRRIPKSATPWSSQRLRLEGHTFERIFDVEGVYDYADTQHVCTSHEVTGGIGRVVVGWPDPAGETALQDPQPALPSRVQTGLEEFNEETISVLENGPKSPS
ncbi:halocyanin [Halobacteria archaeon AArc-curdl1]|uniref:Halocyanin n=1 Tax=Natronosalvus hydrolyticus TaxID=2979988 RepID=A0AAP2Z9L3_9EURY|nr:halocyanin [Halobacteria archaeon AArc-curdl1]